MAEQFLILISSSASAFSDKFVKVLYMCPVRVHDFSKLIPVLYNDMGHILKYFGIGINLTVLLEYLYTIEAVCSIRVFV